MRKKLLSTVLVIAMVFSLAVPAMAANTSFSDMPSDYSTAALEAAAANGLLGGADGKIMPNDSLTRAQMAAVINRAFGATDTASLTAFTDVASGAWYYTDMAKAVQMKTFNGSGSALSPEAAITRQEAFAVLARALNLEDGAAADLASFSDAGSVAGWAVSSTAAMVKSGYVHGADGKINPTAVITRKDFAVLMDNIIKNYITTAGTVTTLGAGSVMINTPILAPPGFGRGAFGWGETGVFFGRGIHIIEYILTGDDNVKELIGKFEKLSIHEKRATVSLVCVLAIIATSLFINNPAIVGASATKRELPIYCVQRDNKCASLSFDAAWGNEDTEMLIEILAKYDVKATFFVVGAWVDKYPESVKALHDAGHEVMNHSDDHAHFSRLGENEIVENLKACNDKIESVTGVRPTLFRCPYGEYDDHVIKTVNGTGMTAVQWDVDSLDWKEISADEITKRVTSRVQPGSIVLFHNAAKHTPEALPGIIEALVADGYELVPISEILLTGDYEIDNAGRQYKLQTTLKVRGR